jgi:diguanylate cyclase (GGDEF)-like protein
MSLIMMDLDNVHDINDQYGTTGGDNVIIAAADVLEKSSRSGDIAARLSGDEFAVLLPDTSGDSAYALAEKIRENVSLMTIPLKQLGSGETHAVHIRTSLGIAVAPDHADNARDLFLTADSALRKAKGMGRNRVEMYG